MLREWHWHVLEHADDDADAEEPVDDEWTCGGPVENTRQQT